MKNDRREFLKSGFAISAGMAGLSGVASGNENLNDEVRREMARRISFLTPPNGAAPDLVFRPSPCVTPFKTPLFVPRVAEPLIDLTRDPYFESWKHDLPSNRDDSELIKALRCGNSSGEAVFVKDSTEEAIFTQAWAEPGKHHTPFSEGRRLDIPHLVNLGLVGAETAGLMGKNNQRYLILFYLLFRHKAKQLMTAGIDLGGFPLVDAHQRFFDFKPLKFYGLWEVEFPWIFQDEDFAKCDTCVPPLGMDPDAVRNQKEPWPHQRPTSWKRGSWSWGYGQLVHLKADKTDEHPVDYPCTFRPTNIDQPGVDPNRLEALNYRFEASSPGPTFHARYGEPIIVRRYNALPEMLNDDDIQKMLATGGKPELSGVRTNIKFALPSTTSHLHNGHTASESDGHPNDWINPGEYWDHHYGNFPSGYDDEERLSTLWYHDHRMDSTAANVYAGLDGFYFLFDEKPNESPSKTDNAPSPPPTLTNGDINDEKCSKGWQLPCGKYDVPLIFHDLLFGDEKSHFVSFHKGETPATRPDDDEAFPQLVFDGFNTDGILGDRFTVNRVIQPVMKVEPRKYRFRLLNGGPSRFYEFVLYRGKEYDNAINFGKKVEDDYQRGTYLTEEMQEEKDVVPFVIITGDGNFQPNPVIARSLYFGVAQRVDVIVDFSDCDEGDELYLVNVLNQDNGRGPDNRVHQRKCYGQTIGKSSDKASDGEEWFFKQLGVVKFQVGKKTSDDESKIRLNYRDTPKVDLTEVKRERVWDFDFDGGLWTVNGLTYDPNRIDAGIEQDTAEIWTFRNLGATWSHPIHSHFTEFLMLEINGVPILQNRISEGNQPDPTGAGVRLVQNPDDGVEDRIPSFENKTGKELKELCERYLKRVQSIKVLAKDLKKVKSLKKEVNQATKSVEAFKELCENQHMDPDELTKAREKCTSACARLWPYLSFNSVNEFLEWQEQSSGRLDLRRHAGYGNPETLGGRFSGGPRRDVALLLPDWEVKVFMRWKDFLGKHVMHCHNVVHEDHAMMIRWDIMPPGHGFDTPKTAKQIYGKSESIKHIEMAPRKANHAKDDSDQPDGR